jgi:hypothetical protein
MADHIGGLGAGSTRANEMQSNSRIPADEYSENTRNLSLPYSGPMNKSKS